MLKKVISDEKNKFKKIITLILLLNILFFFQLAINAQVQGGFIHINEISPGIKGIGKTVFSGTEIEEFDIQVIDIISGTGIDDSYILVKLNGEKIEENGGISAGMSGTPVYFDGKLAGAISHAWEMSEHNLCLVTPINRMLKLFDYNKQDTDNELLYKQTMQPVPVSLDSDLKNRIVKNISKKEEITSIFELADNSGSVLNFEYINTPIFISGFSGRSIEIIQNSLGNAEGSVVKNISGTDNIDIELEMNSELNTLEPGSAVGVQLSTGDASVLTIGTSTYCTDNLVLAFGHPFLHQGNVSYLFSAVYIYHSFPSILMPFKMGTPYKLLGEVVQDRNAGILARLNHFPKVVSCKINIYDLDKAKNIQSGTKIVPQNSIIQSVTNALLVQTIDHAIDRIGLGTANVHIELKPSYGEDTFLYDNMFFSKEDIAVQCGRDFEEIFDLMINNYGEQIDLNEIKLDVTVSEDNKNAIIKEIETDKEEYYPGDIIIAKAVIQPFRQPVEEKVFSIEIPEDITVGEVILLVNGGSSIEPLNKEVLSYNEEKYLIDGWDEIKKFYQEKVKNNQIVAELVGVNVFESTSPDGIENIEGNDDIKKVIDTNFVIEGRHEMYLSIKENKSKDRNNE